MFELAWSVGEVEWKRTRELTTSGPHSEFDLSGNGLIYMCQGTVRFQIDGRLGIPVPITDPEWERISPTARRGYHSVEPIEKTDFRTGYDLSLLDLAVQVVRVLQDPECDADERDWWYFQADDAFRFRFHELGNRVFILTRRPRDRGWMLSVECHAFVDGIERFLIDFGHAVYENASELAEWETTEPIRRFLR